MHNGTYGSIKIQPSVAEHSTQEGERDLQIWGQIGPCIETLPQKQEEGILDFLKQF